MYHSGNIVGTCLICGHWGLLSRHHSKPAIAGYAKKGPIWKICKECHKFLHTTFSNANLHGMTIEQVKAVYDVCQAQRIKVAVIES